MEIVYRCNRCPNHITKIIQKAEDAVGFLWCGACGVGVMERGPLKGPTATVIEVRDNGIMPRRVEQHKDIQEIMKERSDKDTKERKK